MKLARQATNAAEPTEALRALADLRRCLDALETERVNAALQAGCSWRVIAEAIGVSRQAAHRKHAQRLAAEAARRQDQSVAGTKLVIVGPARSAVVLARREAAFAQSATVGTEHLLSGLMREREGPAAVTLTALGVTLDKVRHCARASAERAHGDPETADLGTPSASTPLPFSRRGREALEQSLREAVRLGDGHLGVEHILLALLRDPESRAVQCLERLRVTPAMVEEELRAHRTAGLPAAAAGVRPPAP